MSNDVLDPRDASADDPSTQADRRRYPRQELRVQADVFFGRWMPRRVKATLHDLSETGARVQFDRPLSTTTPQKIRLIWPLSESGRASSVSRVSMDGFLFPHSQADLFGVRFDRLVQEQMILEQGRIWRLAAAAAAVLVAFLVCFLKSRNVISFWYGPVLQLYSLLAAAYVLSRLALSTLYQEPPDRGVLKSISVVLPIKNEESHVEDTIRCIFQSRYPAELLEVIAVDDGSNDRTWEVLQTLPREFPRLKVFRFDTNRGKRHAMALGTQEATGEIVVYMDSDSQVEPEGLYRLVQPFADERVGAVAGHTSVIIEDGNFISKMEAVRYFVSQRVMKAAESVFGTVTCCPGPLSAYRRSAVLRVLPEWLNQTFLGRAATFGDDRSLTNKILKNYQVIYHAGARVHTYVPHHWPTFFRQQLRWKKSWIREVTIATPLMIKEAPLAAVSYFLGLVVTLFSPLVVLRVFFYAPLVLGLSTGLPYIAGLFLVFLMLGLVYYYHSQSRYWYYGLAYAVFYAWLFSLQTYYAAATVRRNHWGTR